MTIREALLTGKRHLEANGIAQPDWNAERLLLLASGMDRARLYADLQRELTPQEGERYQSLLQKRSGHYPLAYLEGTQEFFGREFYVNESVLIPRPETEEIIRTVLSLTLPSHPWILDLGSGSGCIPVTLALEIPGSLCVALEISKPAVEVILRNSNENILIVRAGFEQVPFAGGIFDVVTTNLPYVEEHEYSHLPKETLWEPRLALETRSLEETYSTLLNQSSRILKPGGHLVFEIGFGQSDRLRQLCAWHPEMQLLEIRKDTRQISRVFLARREEKDRSGS